MSTQAARKSTSPSPQMTDSPKFNSQRASKRFSTYSEAPTVNTVKTSFTSESAQQEITDIEEGLEKLENQKLMNQRFAISEEKTENLNKLALGAKLERALGRRMGGQDAVMRKKVVDTASPVPQTEKETTA
ncbi:hypothetical protein PVAG01_04497 [Phlyctema vagabunda]|uniref:Uncharacterized protein n=1 Tax=Phlyctema vagabunda TaxID=108571 RepID=A0ABR4PPK1_9HELO